MHERLANKRVPETEPYRRYGGVIHPVEMLENLAGGLHGCAGKFIKFVGIGILAWATYEALKPSAEAKDAQAIPAVESGKEPNLMGTGR